MSSFKKPLIVGSKEFLFSGLSDSDLYFRDLESSSEGGFAELCGNILTKDSVVLDVGANIGITTAILSTFVPNGKVISIEPDPAVFDLLNLNIEQNHIENIRTFQLALSEREGMVSFAPNSAFGHLVISENQDLGSISVRSTTVDLLVKSLNLDRVDFIKIDVEGFEPNVLSGAKETISKFRPVIYCELNSWCLLDHGDHNPLDFVENLFDSFEHVYMVNRNFKSNLFVLPKVAGSSSRSKARQIVHENIVRNNSWDDLIFFNEPSRFKSPLNQAPPTSIPGDNLLMHTQVAVDSSMKSWLRILRKFPRKYFKT